MGRASEIYKIRLSDQETAALLDRLDAEQVDHSNDRRRSQRHPLRGMGLVVKVTRAGHPSVSHEVKTHDISQHGVGFLSTAAMLPGTMIIVCIPAQKGGQPVQKEAIVRRSRLLEGTVYAIGAEFCSFARIMAEQDKKQPAKAGDSTQHSERAKLPQPHPVAGKPPPA